jgi:hypothetical protein
VIAKVRLNGVTGGQQLAGDYYGQRQSQSETGSPQTEEGEAEG